MLKSKQFCHMISYLSMVIAYDKGNSMAEMTKEFAMIRNFTVYFIKSAWSVTLSLIRRSSLTLRSLSFQVYNMILLLNHLSLIAKNQPEINWRWIISHNNKRNELSPLSTNMCKKESTVEKRELYLYKLTVNVWREARNSLLSHDREFHVATPYSLLFQLFVGRDPKFINLMTQKNKTEEGDCFRLSFPSTLPA